MHKFYDDVVRTKIKKVKALKYSYSKAKYPFSCGQSVIQMYFEKNGILMDQDEIIKLSGDKTLGTSPWEMEETLNKICKEKKLSYKARLEYYTPYSHLFDAIAAGNGVIVMFINQFYEEGYSSTASYPHFALLNYINMGSALMEEDEPNKKSKERKKIVKKEEEKKKKSGKVILTNPSFFLGKIHTLHKVNMMVKLKCLFLNFKNDFIWVRNISIVYDTNQQENSISLWKIEIEY